jgi:hypothetical protein
MPNVKSMLFFIPLCRSYSPRRRAGGMKVKIHALLTLVINGGEWSASRFGRCTHHERPSDIHFIEDWAGSRTPLAGVVGNIPSDYLFIYLYLSKSIYVASNDSMFWMIIWEVCGENCTAEFGDCSGTSLEVLKKTAENLNQDSQSSGRVLCPWLKKILPLRSFVEDVRN